MDSGGGGPPRRATASVGGGGEPPPQRKVEEQPAPAPAPAVAPAVGDRVVLEGLVSRSDLNGKAGAVTALDMARLRAGVKVEGTGEEVMVKFSNLGVREPLPQRKKPGKVQLCDATDVCGKCGAMAARFCCSRCELVKYCGESCQNAHWSRHKPLCRAPQQQSERQGQQDDIDSRLFNASFDGDLREVTAMIAEGADVNWAAVDQQRGTPLIVASQRGHLAVVNALIAARAAVDRSTSQGCTALLVAADNGFDAIVECLIRVAGASVHHVNVEGRTALHYAAQNGHVRVVRVLLRAGANPNFESTDGQRVSPLYLASNKGHLAIVEALIDAGANVNHNDAGGRTSLMVAARFDRIDVVRALLAAVADPRMAVTVPGPGYGYGYTALDAAKEQNHPTIIGLLEARLAELAIAVSA